MKLEESQVKNQEKEVGLHTRDSAASASGCGIPWTLAAQACSSCTGQIHRAGIYQELLNTVKPSTEQVSSCAVAPFVQSSLHICFQLPLRMVYWVKQSDPIQPASHSHFSVWKHMPFTNNDGIDRIREHRTGKILERSSNLLSCLLVESVVRDFLWQMSNLFFKNLQKQAILVQSWPSLKKSSL